MWDSPFLKRYGIPPELLELGRRVEAETAPFVERQETIKAQNQLKVLSALQGVGLGEHHFAGTTGYGYGDSGREALEQAYAVIFGAEAALVRPQIASGTHAIAACLYGVLRPGDRLVAATGKPYDTLEEVIGVKGNSPGSLRDLGVDYLEVPLTTEGKVDRERLLEALEPPTRMVAFQRSRGYSWRPSLSVEELGSLFRSVKERRPDLVCFVDNCYGEFVELAEPTQVGADLLAGSLIKNPGGGLAPTGGYIVGKKNLVEQAANRLLAPGIGSRVGATLDLLRPLFQGLFLAPHVVGEALAGAIFTAGIFAALGFEVSPTAGEQRVDLIQAIRFGAPEPLIAFCRGLQRGAVVDAHVVPYPAPMPGYADEVIMAGSGFVQGSSIELSADAPIRPPYIGYLQGGLAREQVKLGVLLAGARLISEGLIPKRPLKPFGNER
ncbi:MAG: aminotransferase class I/II-fold pyridoxal phosphate-dependent enzyme [Syntrophothermus sp.]